jgi:regulator of sigma E protease
MIVNIIIGLVVLSVIVIVHELGHFISAKATGVRVVEFGLGYPPRLPRLSFKRGETRYSLNAIPFGGFTKMAGEEDPSEPRSLASKSIGVRLLVLSAGSLMNFLLPLILLSVAFMVPHDVVMGEVVVEEVALGSPAAMAGIEPGDAIVSINGKPVHSIGSLNRYLHLNLGKQIDMVISRGDLPAKEVQVIPRWKPPEGEGATGILVSMPNPTVVSQSYPFWKAVPLGVTEFSETFVLYKNGIISMIIGSVPADLVGPVGIVQFTGELAKRGVGPVLEFAAIISLVIAIVNMFPLPALDGGRIVFVLLEWVRRGKRVSPRTEGLIHAIGFFLLIGVMVVVTYQDIIRIISGESLIP